MELALVRRQHHRARDGIAAMARPSAAALAGEGGERVGVEDRRRARAERRRHEFARRRADPQRGAEQHRVLAPVGEDLCEARRALERQQHDRGQVRGVDGERVGRARDA